ncbi:MAG: polysaccharide biosynthesis protein [Marinobacter sp.]|uniref:polysaccharide biosynthesis protein n=1 Tax=Marinobacter sp. TaxID=50741 RepID=UPI00299DA3BF|nr:polysaccharide biosynthesis protein [Marinobacter sp.]MDX1754877.1 polysaccharide biosynthesis protein [Marinobacter sp.]
MNDSGNRHDRNMSGENDLEDTSNHPGTGADGDQNQQDRNVNGEDYRDWDDSRLLVPSSLELGQGAVDRYVNSRQIVRMKEPRTFTNDDLDERRIIYPESVNRKLVNHFRNLRTKLIEISAGNNFTLVVTGAAEGAGSSFVALNLAAAFAFDQSKTALVIDCNLREPSLHSTLDIMPEMGLTDFLDEPDYDIARILYPTGIPRLRLIPAGSRRETPAEFFTSFRMKQFLQAVRRRYPDRFIILDTAPISDSPDARILSELCDYTMLVVPHGRLTPISIEQAVTSFSEDKFVGAVING